MEYTQELQEFVTSLFMEQAKREKAQKIERYRRLNQFVKPDQILFVGSSLMEQFPINELSMDLGLPYIIYNRGVGGFTTRELENVLDVCVYDVHPKHIFINIGTNDLNGPEDSVEELTENYKRIIKKIKIHLPDARIHVMAYYPVNEGVGLADSFMGQIFRYRTNKRICEANEAVKQMSERVGAEFHDFNGGITDEHGNQRAEYTVEGMHMYANGYMAVLGRMIPILETLK